MSHTPGPWEYLKADGVVVTHREDRDVSHEIAWNDADFRLVAAAPDMLDALHVAAEALDNYSDVNDGDDGRPVANRAMSALRVVEAAIAKAERRAS